MLLHCGSSCERPDGDVMLRTHFRFPDGDGFPIHLSTAPSGGLRISDRGHTLMHISYDHEVDAFLDGTRGALLERIVAESGLLQHQGAFCLDTTAEGLPEALFRLGQALTRIYDLTFLSLERWLYVLRRFGRSPRHSCGRVKDGARLPTGHPKCGGVHR